MLEGQVFLFKKADTIRISFRIVSASVRGTNEDENMFSAIY